MAHKDLFIDTAIYALPDGTTVQAIWCEEDSTWALPLWEAPRGATGITQYDVRSDGRVVAVDVLSPPVMDGPMLSPWRVDVEYRITDLTADDFRLVTDHGVRGA